MLLEEAQHILFVVLSGLSIKDATASPVVRRGGARWRLTRAAKNIAITFASVAMEIIAQMEGL